MPAEQTGLVRENYLWKVLLRRGEGKDGEFNHVLDPIYDKQLFQITWGSTVSYCVDCDALKIKIQIILHTARWFGLHVRQDNGNSDYEANNGGFYSFGCDIVAL